MKRAAWLRAGVVGSPHGLDGSFHVTAGRPELLTVGVAVLVGEGERRIIRRAGTDRRPIVRLESCQDRDAAAALRGLELRVSRRFAPELEEEEWWAEDLEGCEVLGADGTIGTVRRLIALPSCELLEVERPDREDLLVPLVRDAVREVDLQRGVIEIELEFLET